MVKHNYKLLTLDPEVDPLADGGRDPVAGDAEVRGHVGAGDAVKHQRGPAHTRHCTIGFRKYVSYQNFIW